MRERHVHLSAIREARRPADRLAYDTRMRGNTREVVRVHRRLGTVAAKHDRRKGLFSG